MNLRTAGDCADHKQRLSSFRDRRRQFRVHPPEGKVFLFGKEAQEGTPLAAAVLTDGPLERGITRIQRVKDLFERDRSVDLQADLAAYTGKRSQVRGQLQPDLVPGHAKVCTSIESTAGRSRTIAFQLSPPSTDPYTWPPVVPKKTPHCSIVSTHIASRSTLT